MSNRNLFKIAGFVGLITIGSKLFGLIRDLVIAHVYGTSITADAYNFAYLLTGNALILLGGLGGPFHSATIAMLTKVKDDAKEAGSFLIKIFSITFAVLLSITILVLVFRENIVQTIAPATGLDEAYRNALWSETITQLEIMSPLIIVSGLLGIACGIANVYGGYFWPSFGPALPSLAIITFVLAYNDPKLGIALGLGTMVGAILQLLAQFPYIIKAKAEKSLEFALVKNQQIVGDYYKFLGPALLSTTIGQLTVYIDGFYCSGLEEGSWTATIFANRLIQLPLGVLSTSFLVPFFPRFSELANEKNMDGLKDTAIVVIRSLWFLTLPIAVYLFLFAKPVVEVIFQRGAFNERSAALVTGILLALLLSMIAYVARDTLTRVFYSIGNSKIPLLIAGISIALKIVLNSLLVDKYQAAGIAFATSLVTVINFLLLSFILRSKIGCMGWIKHLSPILKMLIASSLTFGIGYGIIYLFPNYDDFEFIPKFLFISGSFITMMLGFFAFSHLVKIEEAKKISREIKNKIAP